MNFAERAFRYLFRKKGKAIILFWVLLITETMILSTVTILRASEVARIELLGMRVSISLKVKLSPLIKMVIILFATMF